MLDFYLTMTITCYLCLTSVIDLSMLKCLCTYTFTRTLYSCPSHHHDLVCVLSKCVLFPPLPPTMLLLSSAAGLLSPWHCSRTFR